MKTKPTILVVDDDLPVLGLMKAVLGNYQMTPVTASTGREAFEAVREHDPDLVILDLNMPDITVTDLVSGIRERSPREFLPLMVLSGEPVDESEVEEFGISEAILKPFEVEELIAAIRRELDHENG